MSRIKRSYKQALKFFNTKKDPNEWLGPIQRNKKVDARVKACFLTALSDLQEYEDFKKEVFQEGEGYLL